MLQNVQQQIYFYIETKGRNFKTQLYKTYLTACNLELFDKHS